MCVSVFVHVYTYVYVGRSGEGDSWSRSYCREQWSVQRARRRRRERLKSVRENQATATGIQGQVTEAPACPDIMTRSGEKRVCKKVGERENKATRRGEKKRLKVYRNRVVVFLLNFKKSETSTSSLSAPSATECNVSKALTVLLQSYRI